MNAIYIQAFKVNDEWIYVFGITSSGQVDFVKKYEAEWYNFLPPGT